MAKVEKELTVAEKLANLYKLQVLVSEIDRIRNLRGELPEEVADMEAALEGLKNRISNFNQGIEEADKKINLMQGKIAEAEDLIGKYT
jgi:predicted  nucleic acid-binding Zn-ribbon protein